MGEHFNENLKAARERKNMTQKEVADELRNFAKLYIKIRKENNR